MQTSLVAGKGAAEVSWAMDCLKGSTVESLPNTDMPAGERIEASPHFASCFAEANHQGLRQRSL